MSNPYAADKLIAQARQLAAEYRRTMGKPLPGISSEIAEHDAVRLLGLEPKASQDAGWDAVDPATGLIVFRYEIGWQWQLVWFGGLSLVTVILVNRYLRKYPLESEAPLLNQRAAQLIGQTFELVDPIVNGRGSVHAGDTIWRVEGPVLPKGARVKVVGADGSILKVERAES